VVYINLIFVTVGSQKFQFNRLLMKIDKLIEQGSLTQSEIFAQTGYSSYLPINYNYKKFLNKEEFLCCIERSRLVITHGGTGSILNAIKNEKKVIAIPRESQFGEHVDNHQLEIINQFSNSKLIYGLNNIDRLKEAIDEVNNTAFKKYKSNTNNINKFLNDYIQTL
jgi:UDP-N-acetylglucosamine transferase subunit ALG13